MSAQTINILYAQDTMSAQMNSLPDGVDGTVYDVYGTVYDIEWTVYDIDGTVYDTDFCVGSYNSLTNFTLQC